MKPQALDFSSTGAQLSDAVQLNPELVPSKYDQCDYNENNNSYLFVA